MASRLCRVCKENKPVSEYYKNRNTYNTKCKKCHNEYSRQWRLKNLEYRKNYDLKRNYGITTEDRDNMFTAQSGNCAICKETLDDGLNTHVDHCHTSGDIRGLLCNHCNTGLGKFKDNIDILKSAIEYLAESKGRVTS